MGVLALRGVVVVVVVLLLYELVVGSQCIVDLEDLVFVVGHVSENGHLQVLRAVEVVAQVEFETAVAHLAEIVLVARESRRRGDRHVGDLVDGLLVVVAGLEEQAVLEESEFETDVGDAGLLPAEVGVAHVVEDVPGAGRVPVRRRGGGVGRAGRVGGISDLSDRTDRAADLQAAQPGVFAQELVVVDVDTGTCGPEGRHAVVGPELRRTVHTHRKVEQVDVVIGVVAREEHTHQAGLVFRFRGFPVDLGGVVG